MCTPLRLGLFVVLLAASFTTPAWAQMSAGQMLAFRPKMPGVNCSMPADQELASCKVEPVRNGKANGLKLVDGRGMTLRAFYDMNGDGRLDVWSYFKDGQEIYREIDSKGTGQPDQYRWLGEGGMKWGFDRTGTGRIDYWRQISSDEIGMEVFLALKANDFNRLQPLFITEAEMRSLRMSESEIARIKGQLGKAPAKFRATISSQNMNAGCKFKYIETQIPHCVLGETLGMDSDLIHYPSRMIIYDAGSGAEKIHWVRTGEMIQVGLTWRLADAPGETTDPITPPPPEKVAEQQKIIADHDSKTPPGGKALTAHMIRRVELVQQLLSIMLPQDSERESWYKQMIDNLATAGQEDKASLERLGAILAQLEKARPGSDLSAYVAYREICAKFLPHIGNKLIQEQWHKALMGFVQAYPKTEDTAHALRDLAQSAEFAGKDAEAIRWFEQIYKNFPNHALAEAARGSVRRLQCIGQPFELVGPRIDGGNFSISQMQGKVVAVYYWAAFCDQCPAEFARLKELHNKYGAKGFEVVCVNLDDQQTTATRFLANQPAIGIHLFQQAKTGGSGLSSPLATHYGINGLPTMFLIDRAGKVLFRSLLVQDLEDALKKAL